MQSASFLKSSEWLDDQKASVLFAPFREKSLNPTSWEKKMNFWTNALLECAQIQNDLIIDLKIYRNHFERQGKYPKCLEAVVNEMARTGKLQSITDFERRSSSWISWGVDMFLRRPVVWGFTKLIPASSSSETQLFLVPDQVKKKGCEVLSHHYSKVQHETTDNLMEMSVFKQRCLEVLKSEAECDVVIKQLELDRKLLISKNTDGSMIVKVCNHSEATVQPIREIELNIFRIQKVMKSLEQQIEKLSEQSDSYTLEARQLVKEQKKALALHQLRKRRTLQRQIEKKSSCLDTLHDIIHRVEDASSNEMVVKAYESGVSAIRQLTGDQAIQKVDRVLDDLQEVLEEQEEVAEALAGASFPGSDVSMDVLEKELEDLLAATSPGKAGGREAQPSGAGGDTDVKADHSSSLMDIDALVSGLAYQSLDDLPDVPQSPPGSSSSKTSPQKKTAFMS